MRISNTWALLVLFFFPSLAQAASLEVRSWRALWRGDARRAVALAQEAVDALSGGSEIRPYRALWLYLAASWARELGESGDQDQLELAERLQGEVERTAERLAWMPHHPNRPMTPTVSKEDERAARAATRLAELGVRGRRFETELAALQTQLGASTAKQFEIGLDTLGQMLGFETWRPERDGPKQAAPDGAWRAGGLWLVWEAKSGVGSETPLSVRAVRQAETHERWLEREGRWEQPERKLTLLVAAGRDIDDAAAKIAGEQRLVSTAIVRTIANETMDAYREVRARARGLDTEGRTRAFAKAFIARRLDTAQLQARLSERRVADG